MWNPSHSSLLLCSIECLLNSGYKQYCNTQRSCWLFLLSPLVGVIADQFYVSEKEFSGVISSTDDIFMWKTEKLIFGRQEGSKNKLPQVCPKCIKLLERWRKWQEQKLQELYLRVANFVAVSQKSRVSMVVTGSWVNKEDSLVQVRNYRPGNKELRRELKMKT